MTTANKITILRILLVPFFVFETIYFTHTGNDLHRIVALFIFGLAAASDGLDGYIARRYNQRSELGALLDPLADKLLLVSAVILARDTHPHFEPIPIWFTATVLSRDVLLIIGLLLIHYTFGRISVRPRMLGKVATVLQMATVLWVFLHWDKDAVIWLAAAAAITTALAGLVYVWDGMTQLSKHPTSSPTKGGNV